eukprot:6130730-Amphidinium_carterae.1
MSRRVQGKETIRELSATAFALSDLPGYVRDIRSIARAPLLPIDSPHAGQSTEWNACAFAILMINDGKKPVAGQALMSGRLVPEGVCKGSNKSLLPRLEGELGTPSDD